MNKTLLTRRSFVQAAAATGVAAAFGVSMSDSLVETDKAYAESAPSVKTYKSMCHGCIDYCAVKVTLEDGVAVKIVGDETSLENRTSCCMKCLNQLHTAYSPRRILHPMKLAGEWGSGEWEIISWDEAIDLAASKIFESIKKYGHNSIFTSHGGGGSYNGAFAYGIAESFYSPTAFEPGGAQCFVPRSSITPMITGCNSTSIADSFDQEPFKPNTETNMLVLWAMQPSISQTAKAGRGMAELRSKGCKTIVIDPNFSPDAAKADVWLPVRPGTDTALVLCWMRYIVDNGLYDETFCKCWTTLPFLINPETNYPWLTEEVWPDYKNPPADPNDKYSTPAYVCFDKKTNSIQPLSFTAAENSPVDPELFTEFIHLGETVDNTIPAGKIRNRTFEMLGEEPDPAFPAWPGNDSEEAIRQQVADTFGVPSWDELKENQDDYVPLVIPEDEYWTYYQYLDIVDDGLPAGFATESRKCKPYCATMVKASRTGFPYIYPPNTVSSMANG